MKAVVFHKPKDIRVETVDDPKIEDPQDAILRITLTAICGSDLHIYNGLFPQINPLILGHEFMGVVEEVGSEVQNLKKGDRVVVPFPISCGRCWFCEHGLPIHCENSNRDKYGPEGAVLDQKGGGLFGYTDLYGGYPGGQAEMVRVPYADVNPRKVPDELTDEQVLFLTDILPTGWISIEWADVKEGDSVAVYGCGPVGLMAMKSAWLHGASKVFGLDVEPYRMDMAKKTANAETILVKDGEHVQKLREMTDGRGPDAVVDAAGMEAHISAVRKLEAAVHAETGTIEALSMAISSVRRGGRVSVMGVYATVYDNFPFGQIFDKGLTLRGGQAPVQDYIDQLMDLIREGKIRADDIITHRIGIDEAPQAYKMFNNKEDNCVKVVIKP
ncbi:MAG: zinc-dependent alcohol dehydrogenase [Armatimonadota bacterium]|nr:glutathione-dependent formaldehyde dehydrogenase [bacterium]